MEIVELLRIEALKSQETVTPTKDDAYFSRSILQYEHCFGISMKKVIRGLQKKQEQNNSILVLDVMCGGGTAVEELNKKYSVNAFGIDSIYYPNLAESKIRDKYIINSAENLSIIPDKSIDLVLNCIGYRDYIKDWQKAFSESLRVLKNGGELLTCPDYQEYHNFLESYKHNKSIQLNYQSSRRLSWHRFPPVRMLPVLHVTKPKIH